MDGVLFRKLSEVDYKGYEFYLRNTLERFISREKSIFFTYLLYKAQNSDVVFCSEMDDEEFVSSLEIILDMYINNNDLRFMQKIKKSFIESINMFSNDELCAYILFFEADNLRNEATSTPRSICSLSYKLLDIKDSDEILDMCSGYGNFMLECMRNNNNAKCSGIDVNSELVDLSKIRFSILNSTSTEIKIGDVLVDFDGKKYDKIFSNYPFRMRPYNLDESIEKLSEMININECELRTRHSDWLFNLSIMNRLKEDGKAIVFMINGALMNRLDEKLRKFFVENAYIESVISLPKNLFYSTMVETTAIVLSRNNHDKIRMVDATDIFTKDRLKKSLSDENIDEILSLIAKDSKKSKDVDISEVRSNDYTLSPIRYLLDLPKLKDGVALKNIVKSIIRGSQLRASDLESLKSDEVTKYRYLLISNLNSGVVLFDEGEQYLKEIPDRMKKYCIKNNSIVISKLGNPDFKSAVVRIDDDCEIMANGNLFLIELDEDKVNPYFLQSYLESNMCKTIFRSFSSGSVISTLSIDTLENLEVPYPSIEEQNRIGNIYKENIDEVNSLKKKLEIATEKLEKVFDDEYIKI